MINKFERQIYIVLLAFLLLLTLSLGGFIFYRLYDVKKYSAPSSAAISLKALPIRGEDIVIKTSYVGYAEAINQVQIVPYISGYLDKIAIQPGQTVHRGEALLTINDSEYQAKFEAANAAVMQAKAAFNYSKDYYERVQKTGKKAFSEIDIDNAKNNFLQAEANLMSARANKKYAEVNLQYTKINAPISGLIGNFTLSPGDYVSPAQSSLLTIIQTSPIRVVFSLTDIEYFNLKKDNSLFKNSVIKLTLPNGKPFKYTGHFQYTDNKINKNTNALAVYAYFENDDNDLLPNTFVTVDVYHTLDNAVAINKNQIKMTNDGYFINIGRNHHLVLLPVQILAEKDNQYIIKNDFQTGDVLVTDNVADITDKTEVNFLLIHS